MIHIGGISVAVFGDLESGKPKSGIFLLHGRMQKREIMYEFARDIKEQVSTGVQDALVFLINHRNHGDRKVDLTANKGWDQGNQTHAFDMYAIQMGTAADVSFLIKMIPIATKKVISLWSVVGFSMGAHSTLLAMSHEPMISFGVSIAGCGDYKTLIMERASHLGLSMPPDSYEYISHELLEFIKANDSINLADRFYGKKLLMIQGEKDQCVPSGSNTIFLEALESAAPESCQLYIAPGTGHELTLPICQKVIDWLRSNSFSSFQLINRKL